MEYLSEYVIKAVALVRKAHVGQKDMEGPDDMPSHAKTILVGPSLTIPITGGRPNLGTWQGIYLCEFRNHGGTRHVVATITGE